MGTVKQQRYCVAERKPVLAERQTPNQILHLILTVLTGGLWVVVWIGVNLFHSPFLCPTCGGRTEGMWYAKREEKRARKAGN